MTVFFVLIAMVVLAVRRGRLGRILVAVRDSPAAAGTLGIDMRWLRVGLFAASAGIAGLAGALFAGLRGTIVAFDFQFFASLLLLLMAVVWGVTSVTGAALGGIFLMYLPGGAVGQPVDRGTAVPAARRRRGHPRSRPERPGQQAVPDSRLDPGRHLPGARQAIPGARAEDARDAIIDEDDELDETDELTRPARRRWITDAVAAR